MRPTPRGWTVVAVVVAAMATSWHHGPRSLDAVVVPLFVVTVAAVGSVLLADPPTVRRHAVADGFPGDRRTVAVTVESDRAIAATVRDGVGVGLEPVDGPVRFETTLEGERRLEYDVRLEGRGQRTVGPLSITVTDVFGLVSRRFVVDEMRTVVVYPRVYEVDGAADGDLRSRIEATVRAEREEFDYLREYRRGDPMRDVNWKASAKRPDGSLVVTEYASDQEAPSVTIAADGSPARADEFATAVATLVTLLLERGIRVGLVLEDERSQSASGPGHYRTLLEVLATTDGSALDPQERAAADVLVRTDETGTTVTIADTELSFGELRGSRAAAQASRLADLDRHEAAATPGQEVSA